MLGLRFSSRSSSLSTAGRFTPFVARLSTLASIQSSQLVVRERQASEMKPKPDFSTVAFGSVFTDHMLTVEWNNQEGWGKPEIRPHGNISLDPAASSLHYAIQGFEGMKAYKDDKGRVRLFRPEMNMARLNSTARAMSLPEFEGQELLECIRQLVKIDRHWVPSERGYSLYIRPNIFSTQKSLGVSAPTSAMITTLLCPVGPYYKTGFKAVKLLADKRFVRAWPGGTGNVKCGGNYGLTIRPQQHAEGEGYSQLLWLFGPELNVTEVGTMNMFFLWKTKTGETELITAPLDGTILPGVTRDSVLSLARQWGQFSVVERPFSIWEVVDAINEARVIEAFGVGTAALVCPVKEFSFEGKDYKIPLDPTDSNSQMGKLTRRLFDTMFDIQYGSVEHEWSQVIA